MIVEAVVGAVAELLADGPEVAACGLDHQGESVLAWDAESGKALTPVVTWQDKRSQEVLDRLESQGRAEEIRERSGMPLDPYFSAGKLAWLLEHDQEVAKAVDAGTARLGTVDSFLCDRLGAGFATDPSTASRTQLGAPEWDPALLEIFGVPRAALPQIMDTAGRSRHAAPRIVAGRAATAGTLRGPAGGARRGGVRRAGPGQGDLRHRGLRARPRRHRAAQPGRGLAADGRMARRRPSRVGDRRRRVHRRGAAGMAQPRPRPGGRPGGARLGRGRGGGFGGVRVLPALAGVGAPWWKPEARAVLAGLTSGSRPAHIARAALEAIAWRVADIVDVVRETVPVEVLRVDGGLTRDTTLLQLQADTAGVSVQRGAVDATVAGAAALAAVGAGIWDSTLEIAERIPIGERTEPQRDASWRDAAHAEWREFVERAVVL